MVLKSSFSDLLIPDVTFPVHALRQLEKFGDEVAMVDFRNGTELTYRDMRDKSMRCAISLKEEGLEPGDVVAICSQNCIEYTVIFIAVTACGATLATVNPEFKSDEMMHQFRTCKPKIIFCEIEAVERVHESITSLGFPEKVFVIGENKGYQTFERLLTRHNMKSLHSIPPSIPHVGNKDDIALLLSSSGTTGMPKCVMFSHYNVLSLMEILRFHSQMSSSSVFYGHIPMFSAGGLTAILLCLGTGSKVIIDRGYDVEMMLKCIEEQKVTHSLITPPTALEMSQTQLFEKFDTSSLVELVCGGAPLSENIMRAVEKKYSITMSQCYGLTEVDLVSYGSRSTAPKISVGLPTSNCHIKIIDVYSGEELGPNADGEILVKAPQLAKGYLKNPTATAKAIDSHGWMHTGDLGRYDNGGALYVIGRLKNLIKYKTLQVSPAELEHVLAQHPKISEAAVIGIADARTGEVPKAFVVKAKSSLNEKEVKEYIEGRLADHKRLRGGVKFLAALPRTPTGKIHHQKLREMNRMAKSDPGYKQELIP